VLQKTYRSVTLRLLPTPKQAEILDKNFRRVSKFLGISKREFQKLIWKRAREDEELSEVHTRLLDLMAQRFAGAVMGNLLYPLDERNYKFVKENGYFKIAVKFEPRKAVTINVDRSYNKYYSDIIENVAYPAFIYKDGGDYFLSVAIPHTYRWEESRKTVYCGIDLNMRKHVASFYVDGEFKETVFFDLAPVDRKIKQIQRTMSAIQKGKRADQLTDEEKAKLARHRRRIKKVIQKGHGDFISKLIAIADKYWDEGYNVVFVLEDLKGITKNARKDYRSFNRWLHSQWCYRRFAVLLESKPYPVKYVPPKDTSKLCHRCGGEVRIHGKRGRLVSCDKCGLKDFSRDLNAARNIAKLALEE